jgi:hypothetical protein
MELTGDLLDVLPSSIDCERLEGGRRAMGAAPPFKEAGSHNPQRETMAVEMLSAKARESLMDGF